MGIRDKGLEFSGSGPRVEGSAAENTQVQHLARGPSVTNPCPAGFMMNGGADMTVALMMHVPDKSMFFSLGGLSDKDSLSLRAFPLKVRCLYYTVGH